MMNFYTGMMGGGNTFGLLGLITWLALIVFLVLGSIYFWQGINRKKK